MSSSDRAEIVDIPKMSEFIGNATFYMNFVQLGDIT